MATAEALCLLMVSERGQVLYFRCLIRVQDPQSLNVAICLLIDQLLLRINRPVGPVNVHQPLDLKQQPLDRPHGPRGDKHTLFDPGSR